MTKIFSTSLRQLNVLLVAIVLTAPALAHQGHTHRASVEACEDHQRHDSCQYEHADSLYIGSCQLMQEALMCVRNQPLMKKANIHESAMPVQSLDNSAEPLEVKPQ
ncbi:hypothetical protein KO507_06895 [Gilvimarinus agarilyticus]|uniref:hypothetical protein n=1 Tax=unclassified Gilvimarinus TaxID=2642066 RepID=UPI001C0893C5|nr:MULTISPECIES: hypothetical protein [unclassified Gilvimarinus]MBU2885484.1 hypothetical protein [Gilvimarinus agarilyticus]MDO6570384.1 hypothetical protein [Gilvimarinus sp. 2_MG-2023]MDO6748442.1 hypothetical protein [Gilvimarinus sp. 1_MG-2023]